MKQTVYEGQAGPLDSRTLKYGNTVMGDATRDNEILDKLKKEFIKHSIPLSNGRMSTYGNSGTITIYGTTLEASDKIIGSVLTDYETKVTTDGAPRYEFTH